MVGLALGDPYYEPISLLRRLFDSSKLHIRNVFQSGMRLKFIGSLQHEIHGVGGGLASNLVNSFDAATGSTYANESIFLGYIDRPGNPPLDSFPFDTWLTLRTLGPVFFLYEDEAGRLWQIINIALTHVCDIEVENVA